MSSTCPRSDASDLRSEAYRIFNTLQHSKAYLDGHERAKRAVISQLLAIKPELQKFVTAPGRKPHEIIGFFVECCARFSSLLPRNTPRAEQYAQNLLSYLKEGYRSNPDHIWITIRGRRITITGIGEVKTQPSSLRHKPFQSMLQKRNIRNLARRGDIQHILATKSRVIFTDPLEHYIIFPRRINGPYHLPFYVSEHWQIKEIEFSLPEIQLLKRILLGKEREEAKIAWEYPRDLYVPFVAAIHKQAARIIDELYASVPAVTQDSAARNALTAWMILFQNVPADREAIDCVIEWVKNIPDATANALFPFPLTAPTERGKFRQADISLCKTLTKRFSEIPQSLIIAVLNTLRDVKRHIPKPPAIKTKEIKLFSLV